LGGLGIIKMEFKTQINQDGTEVAIIPERQDDDYLINRALIFCNFLYDGFYSGPRADEDILNEEKICPDGHYFQVYLAKVDGNGTRAICAQIISGREDDRSKKRLGDATNKLERLMEVVK
jgi:hypothetical protein